MDKTNAEELQRTTQNDDDDDDDFDFPSPTDETYGSFYEAYRWLNLGLFEEQLPDCLITMQRSKRSRGYFSSERFGSRHGATELVDEIALNPRAFIDRSDREIISTLAHEMVHLWQFHFGKPGRGRYHNKQWAAKMIEIGLIPSHTGAPGGKQTGQAVTHYILDGGRFDKEWELLVENDFVLRYQDRSAMRPVGSGQGQGALPCPSCDIHVWGKPDLHIACLACNQPMT